MKFCLVFDFLVIVVEYFCFFGWNVEVLVLVKFNCESVVMGKRIFFY